MADLPTNWTDDVGMVENAAFLNLVGTNVNANTAACAKQVSGSVNGTDTPLTLWTGTAAQYAALASKDANTAYLVTA